MKKILGLDIGTNSIGGALINLPKSFEDYGKGGSIEWLGSRIIPTDGDYLQKFEAGSPVETKAAFRRIKRGSRRLKHRYHLRRTRLTQVFKILGWLDVEFPENFKKKIRDDESFKFSMSDYLPFSIETIEGFEKEFGIYGKKSKKGHTIIPEDWIIYFLRKKALSEKITFSELARIIYMMNQRRGFKSSRKDLKDSKVLPYDFFINEINRFEYKEGQGKEIETQFVSITKVQTVTLKEEKKDKKGNTVYVYIIVTEDRRMRSWEEVRKQKPEWEGKEFTFLVVQKLDNKGNLTQNKPQIPKEDNWALCTTALDEKFDTKHPGTFFFDELIKAQKENRNYKIRQYPVYRWRYQNELVEIWEKQCELNDELRKINSDKAILQKLAEMLYTTQVKARMPKLNEFLSNDLLHVINNDIIYYQRELKSQKSSISECRYEKRKGIDGETYGLKCIPRSSPLFQEFRIWQDIHNIRLLEREIKEDGKTKLDVDVTVHFINEMIKEKLFDLFHAKVGISEKDILKLLKDNYPNSNIKLDIDKKEKIHSHRINLFVNRNELKGNEALARYNKVFEKAEFNGESTLADCEKLFKLWHIDYSISSYDEEKSKKGITTALKNLLPSEANKEKVIEMFSTLPELKKEYGSFSAMAIKKMLPVMRCGKYWNKEGLTDNTKERAKQIKERIDSINNNLHRINEIADDEIQKQVLKSFIGKDDLTKGLNTYQAGYLIYEMHSEKDKSEIKTIEDLSLFIQKAIPNNSLRNPIVELVVRETMYLVRDLWKNYGQPDEIHIELGRELKKNSEEKFKISEQQNNNNSENQRIKKLLYELMNGFEEYDEDGEIHETIFKVKPNPESPRDIEKFRIWKENSLVNKNVIVSKKNGNKTINIVTNVDIEFDKLYKDGKKERIPSRAEIKKYALWLSQNCRSPYTGKIISLSKLFDPNQYEVEHIIPRAKLKNDSFSNLVISEWGVNKAKGNQLAANFIANSPGKCNYGDKEYTLLTYDEYDKYCNDIFKFQKSKRKNLLATEVPDDFVERQLNDTRYIGRKLAEMLAPVAKNENGIIFTGGMITSELKKNWGLNKEWKKLMLPRFKRLESITGENYIKQNEHDRNDIDINVPENQELEIKRIDHRHHALDALIIAATTREHIRYLNSLSAIDTDEELKNVQRTLVKGKIREFKTPWDKFTEEARLKLEETIVSFKINNKVVSKPYNKTAYWKQKEDGTWKKEFKTQENNPKWIAVRKSMFKEPQGIVYIKEILIKSFRTPKEMMDIVKLQIARMEAQNTPKQKNTSYIYDQEIREIVKDIIELSGGNIEVIEKFLKKFKPVNSNGGKIYTVRIAVFNEFAAKRVTLDKSFDFKKIDKIPYAKSGKSVIGKLLYEHLNSKEYDGEPSLAFSGEGLETLAKKAGKPITKVTIVEQKNSDSKFGNQYVEVDAGSNAFFIIYENELTKEREYQSLATHKAIENLKNKGYLFEEKDGFKTITLSPNDLVYVPSIEELKKIKQGISENEAIDWYNKKNIFSRTYKMNSCTGSKCEFVPHSFVNQKPIIDKIEFGANNINQRAWDGDVKLIPNKRGELIREDSGTMIKNVCIKIKLDRLGSIIETNGKKVILT